MKFGEYEAAVKKYLSSKLSGLGVKYGSSTVFGQLLTVLGSTTENTMSYIEDGLTEQNKYTAQRKRSVYSMATMSGYIPSTGNAAAANLRIAFKPNNSSSMNILVHNRAKITCLQNGMQFNLVLPQENVVMDIDLDGSVKQMYAVEGKFETQRFYASGGKLYSQLVRTTGDTDADYLSVKVNGETWECVDSIYDMLPDGKQYIVRPAQVKGFVVTFGNDSNGRAMVEGDSIEITYLLHSGEQGNIDPEAECQWMFAEPLHTTAGEEIDANEILYVTCDDTHGVTSGTYSESTEQVRAAIGTNSRSLVLADPKNYKNLISRFSFCGYSRTWSDEGSLVIHSIIMRNFKELMKSGKDYFSLEPSDFTLTDAQKSSVLNTVERSGQQLAGAVYTIFDPELCKYSCYIYIKMKNVSYNEKYVSDRIRTMVGEFFSNIKNDLFVPKSDLVHLIKSSVDEVDSVDVYFLSEKNETAIINGYYTQKTQTYNPATGRYSYKTETIPVDEGENPGVGLDEHGNIWLESNDEFPVLMGGWRYKNADQYVDVVDPLEIVIVNQ